MPVDTFAAGDLFRVTIIKNHALNPSDSWANTYEIQSKDGGVTMQLLEAANRLTSYERHYHFNTTVFDRYIVSTWEPDSAPYNPINFITVTIGEVGMATPPATPVGLSTCLHIARNVSYGRVGHLFYRNVLGEGDIQAPSGKTVLTDPSGQSVTQALHSAAVDLPDMMGDPPDSPFGLVMIDKTANVVRPVQSFIVKGVSQVKLDHKWYNRTGSP
ncbi:MAG: hypothetical protein WAM70_22355 [Pyrinomonadaceae bacterium]